MSFGSRVPLGTSVDQWGVGLFGPRPMGASLARAPKAAAFLVFSFMFLAGVLAAAFGVCWLPSSELSLSTLYVYLSCFP